MSEFKWEKLSSQRDTNYWFMTHRAKVEGGWLYRTFDLTNHEGVKSTSESMVFVPDSPDSSVSGVLKQASTDQHVYEGLCKRIAWDVLRELKDSQPNVSQDGEWTPAALNENIAKLSFKINTMQSDLLEFEKQKFVPLREAFICFKQDKDSEDNQPTVKWSDYKYLLREIKLVQERIEKLEKQSDDVYILDKHNNDLFSRLEGRIKKLEAKTTTIDNILSVTYYPNGQYTYSVPKSPEAAPETLQSNDQFFHDELVQHEHRIKNLELTLHVHEKNESCDIGKQHDPLKDAIPCANVSDTPYKPQWLPGESPMPQKCLHSWTPNDNPREERCLWCCVVREKESEDCPHGFPIKWGCAGCIGCKCPCHESKPNHKSPYAMYIGYCFNCQYFHDKWKKDKESKCVIKT